MAGFDWNEWPVYVGISGRIAPEYAANRIEQDHRGVRERYYPTLSFHDFDAAQRFCRVVDEVRHFFRPRRWMGEEVSLAGRRAHFLQQVAKLHSLFAPA